jgi:hypothetical protein
MSCIIELIIALPLVFEELGIELWRDTLSVLLFSSIYL